MTNEEAQVILQNYCIATLGDARWDFYSQCVAYTGAMNALDKASPHVQNNPEYWLQVGKQIVDEYAAKIKTQKELTMIDLSDILQPIDITVKVVGGFIYIVSRASLFEQVQQELLETAAIYGIKAIEQPKNHTIIFSVWSINLPADKIVALAQKLVDYYKSKNFNTVLYA